MALDIISLALSKKFTEDSLSGVGAIAGKPCQISSITDITGGHRVNFLWIDNEGTSHTAYMDVMDGAQGIQGDPGETPEIEVASITGGHRVTITTGSDVDTFDVMDGKNGKDGKGVPTVELTQAQYDALPEEEKMNGTEYFITDGVI